MNFKAKTIQDIHKMDLASSSVCLMNLTATVLYAGDSRPTTCCQSLPDALKINEHYAQQIKQQWLRPRN